MSATEESRQRRKSGYRTVMDIVMGFFYTIVGVFIFFYKVFFDVAIPQLIAYLIGFIMAVGGIARLVRGFKSVFGRAA